MGVLMVWPYNTDRFVIPVLPLLLYFHIVGVQWSMDLLGANRKIKLMPFLLAAIFLSSLVHILARIHADCEFRTRAAELAGLYEIGRWSAINLPVSATVATSEADFFYIYSKRRQTAELGVADYFVACEGEVGALFCSEGSDCCLYERIKI